MGLLISSISTTGCITINNGPADGSSQPSETITKEIIVESNNSTTTPKYTNEYIFSDSSTRYLSYSDLSGLTTWELKIARNEIYARRGRMFNDSDLQNYFDSCSWYTGYIQPDNFDDKILNKIETANAQLIKKYE